MRVTCTDCGGTRRSPRGNPCSVCGGTGTVERTPKPVKPAKPERKRQPPRKRKKGEGGKK